MVFVSNRRFRSRHVRDLYRKKITEQVRGFQRRVRGRPAGDARPVHQRPQKAWNIITVGTWFEMLIFSYFGLLALTQTVQLYGITVDGIVVFIVTGLVGLAIFIPLYKKVRANQVSRAEQAFPVA